MILVLCYLTSSCEYFPYQGKYDYLHTISNLGDTSQFVIPLQCKDWCISSVKVVENSANDSVKIVFKYYAPGQTGVVYSIECCDCFTQERPWTWTYIPYKATQGSVVIKFSLAPY